MDARDLATARVIRFLEQEPVIWLSTVCADGAPHLVPTWFVWDGEAIVIVSKAGAVKVRNLRAEPRAMVALGDAEDDFDVSLLEVAATVLDAPTPRSLPAGFVEKYGARIAELGLTPAQFAGTYAAMIRLTPVKALGWHGRSRPASVVAAARRVAATGGVSLQEPVRGLRQWLGEPLAGGFPGLGQGPARRAVAI